MTENSEDSQQKFYRCISNATEYLIYVAICLALKDHSWKYFVFGVGANLANALYLHFNAKK